jgi:uncharacterized protein YyaL (SSP411 family)
VQDERFLDAEGGGWFSTTGQDPAVLLRLKEDTDGAEPSASAVSMLNVLTLVHLTGDERRRGHAELTLARFGPKIGAAARALPMMLCALSAWHAGFTQIVVVGDPATAAARGLHRVLAERYLPFALVIPVSPGSQQDAVSGRLEFVRGMTAGEGAAAYVCRDFTCQQPVSQPSDLAALLTATA